MQRIQRWGPLIAVLAALLILYLLTLQRDVNGSGHPYMIDVGEIQVALNLWGTIHHTGYPLYTMIGAALVALFRTVGVNPAASASLVSLGFGLGAVAAVYALLLERAQPWVAGSLALVLGVMQSFWIHSVAAEVYSLYALFAALILWWVLKDDREWSRRDWLIAALMLGLGIGHHRAVAFLLPGLALYLWPQVRRDLRSMPLTLLLGSLIVLGTFLVYLYLPLRDGAGARWVYGQPGTWDGFWHEFLGREAQREMDPPHSLADFGSHAGYVLGVLADQVTWPGLVIGFGTMGGLLAWRETRRHGAALIAGALAYLGFAFWLPEAVLAPAFLMPVLILFVVAVAMLPVVRIVRAGIVLAGASLLLAAFLIPRNLPFIRGLTQDPAGRATITHVASLPRGEFDAEPVLMLPWGGSYFAVSYGRYVTGELSGFTPVDHRADFAAILDGGSPLLTLPETFYVFPLDQWAAWLGEAHLSSAGSGFVSIQRQPTVRLPGIRDGFAPTSLGNGLALLDSHLTLQLDGSYALTLLWLAERAPEADYSVFVHLARVEEPASAGDILAQFDSSAPVYGWYPTTRWAAGEVVRDDYAITPPPGYDGPLFLRVGMYRALPDGAFEDFPALAMRVR